MVTFTLDTQRRARAHAQPRHPRAARYWSRTPYGGGAGAGTTVQHAAAAVASGAANAVLVYRAFNERSGRRFGQPHAARPAPPALELVPAVRARHAGEDVRALVPALHARVRRHQRGLRPLHGRRPPVTRRPTRTRGSTSGRSRSRTTRSRAGSSSRSCGCSTAARRATAASRSSSPRAERARDLPQPRGAHRRPPPTHISATAASCSTTTTTTSPCSPRREFLGRQLWERSGSGPTTSTSAMIYENFSPLVFLQLEAFGFCGPGEAKDFIADGNIDLDGKLPVNTHGGLLGEAYIHGMNNIARRRAPGAGHRRQPGRRRRARAGRRGPERPGPRPRARPVVVDVWSRWCQRRPAARGCWIRRSPRPWWITSRLMCNTSVATGRWPQGLLLGRPVWRGECCDSWAIQRA